MEMKGRMWDVLGVGVALCLRSARRERRVQFGRVLEAATSGKKKKRGEPQEPWDRGRKRRPRTRSRIVSRVSETTSGPGRSPWGGGFRVAMIRPAACTEGGRRPPSSPHYFMSRSRPGWKSVISFFFLLLLLLQACYPVPTPSSERKAFCATLGAGEREVG